MVIDFPRNGFWDLGLQRVRYELSQPVMTKSKPSPLSSTPRWPASTAERRMVLAGRAREAAQLGIATPDAQALLLLPDQPPERLPVGRQQLGDPRVVDVGDDDLAHFLVDL